MSSTFIDALRNRIGDADPDPAKHIWSDDQLEEWLLLGFSEWSYGTRSEGAANLLPGDSDMALKLAHSSAMYELATGTALYFKWVDQQKSIDKSMTPETCRRIGKDLWEQVNSQRKSQEALVGTDPRRVAQGGVAQFDAGSRQTDRTGGRGWL